MCGDKMYIKYKEMDFNSFKSILIYQLVIIHCK